MRVRISVSGKAFLPLRSGGEYHSPPLVVAHVTLLSAYVYAHTLQQCSIGLWFSLLRHEVDRLTDGNQRPFGYHNRGQLVGSGLKLARHIRRERGLEVAVSGDLGFL